MHAAAVPAAVPAAIARIAERRARNHDSALEALPDDPAGVVRHVLTHRRTVPAAALVEDLADALIISRAMRDAQDRLDLALLRATRAEGFTWQQLADVLGYRGRQGPREWMLRLEAWSLSGRRDVRPGRAQRATLRRRIDWLDRNRLIIRNTAHELDVLSDDLPETGDGLEDFIDGVSRALADPDASPTELITWIKLAARCHARAEPHMPALACQTLAGALRLADAWDEVCGEL